MNEQQFRNQIIKHLDNITASGNRPGTIFEDWVSLVRWELDRTHKAMLATVTGEERRPAAELQERRDKVQDRYNRGGRWEYYRDLFSQATASLIDATRTDYMDVLGSVYMEWGGGGRVAGQFFTPFPVARMMARMLGIKQEVQERLVEAVGKSIPAQARVWAGLTVARELHQCYFVARVLPHLYEHYRPVRHSDPCCGSGVMFLASAAELPNWMNQAGLVRYAGQDISHICVEMCRTNMMLYGLDGSSAPFLLMRAESILQAHWGNTTEINQMDEVAPAGLPEPAPAAARPASGEPPEQLSLFDFISEPEPVYVTRPALPTRSEYVPDVPRSAQRLCQLP